MIPVDHYIRPSIGTTYRQHALPYQTTISRVWPEPIARSMINRDHQLTSTRGGFRVVVRRPKDLHQR
jgi:hypothetical protein